MLPEYPVIVEPCDREPSVDESAVPLPIAPGRGSDRAAVPLPIAPDRGSDRAAVPLPIAGGVVCAFGIGMSTSDRARGSPAFAPRGCNTVADAFVWDDLPSELPAPCPGETGPGRLDAPKKIPTKTATAAMATVAAIAAIAHADSIDMLIVPYFNR
jgi:hypothetical protein